MHGGSFDTSAYHGYFFISSVKGVAPWLNNHIIWDDGRLYI